MRAPAVPIANDAELVGIWTVRYEAGEIQEAAFYKRVGDTAYLWVVQGSGLVVYYGQRRAGSMQAQRRVRTLVVDAPAEWPDRYQAVVLVDRLFRSRPPGTRISKYGRGCLFGWHELADLGWFTPPDSDLERAKAERRRRE